MRTLILGLVCLFICGLAYALPDRQPGSVYSGNQLIKSSFGDIIGMIVSFKGVTAGDYIQIIDGTTAAGTVDASVYAPAANGTIVINPVVSIHVDSGIYYNEVKTGGAFYTEMQYQ